MLAALEKQQRRAALRRDGSGGWMQRKQRLGRLAEKPPAHRSQRGHRRVLHPVCQHGLGETARLDETSRTRRHGGRREVRCRRRRPGRYRRASGFRSGARHGSAGSKLSAGRQLPVGVCGQRRGRGVQELLVGMGRARLAGLRDAGRRCPRPRTAPRRSSAPAAAAPAAAPERATGGALVRRDRGRAWTPFSQLTRNSGVEKPGRHRLLRARCSLSASERKENGLHPEHGRRDTLTARTRLFPAVVWGWRGGVSTLARVNGRVEQPDARAHMGEIEQIRFRSLAR